MESLVVVVEVVVRMSGEGYFGTTKSSVFIALGGKNLSSWERGRGEGGGGAAAESLGEVGLEELGHAECPDVLVAEDGLHLLVRLEVLLVLGVLQHTKQKI